jgi:hypothetical protein
LRLGLPDYLEDLNTGNIGVIGAFLSFFLIFFVVANQKCFDMLYASSMSCEGHIFDIATLPKPNDCRLI